MRIGFDRRRKRNSNLEIVEIDDAIIHAPEGLRPIVLRHIF